MKRMISLFIVMVLGLSLIGCGANDDVKDPTTPASTIGAEQGSPEQPITGTTDPAGVAVTPPDTGADEDTPLQDIAPEPYKQPKPDGYYFMHNGSYIAMNEDAEQVFTEIGEPDKIFESPSCAFKGIDKKLYYDGFLIDTYPNGDKDLILSITLTDASVKTPEGVGIGMKFEDMVTAYGNDYDNMLDLYSYTKDGVKLSFLFEDNVVVDVSYYYTLATN